MKYLNLDQATLKVIDDFFNSTFSYYQLNQEPVELYRIFPWTYDFNHADVCIMLEDLKKEIDLKYYIPKQYLLSPIKFLNYIMKQLPNLREYYLNPNKTSGIFRTYYLKFRY